MLHIDQLQNRDNFFTFTFDWRKIDPSYKLHIIHLMSYLYNHAMVISMLERYFAFLYTSKGLMN